MFEMVKTAEMAKSLTISAVQTISALAEMAEMAEIAESLTIAAVLAISARAEMAKTAEMVKRFSPFLHFRYSGDVPIPKCLKWLKRLKLLKV